MKICAESLALSFSLAMLLTGCGESTEEAYKREYDAGLHDGWADTCNDIER